MNAIELLKKDHRKVEELFKQSENTEDTNKKFELFEQIKNELETHTHIEETIFYPKLKEHEELKDIVLEGIEEHHQAKIFLREISGLKEDSEKFEPKLKVLQEDIEHHVEEEEGEMFPKVEKIFESAELEELGAQMEAEKKSFQKSQTASAGK